MKSYHDIALDGGSDVSAQVAAQTTRTEARLRAVRHIVAVMSGKGGVGKSTVTANLAAALAERGHAVGILDGDINGPSIGRMAGVQGHSLRRGSDGVEAAVASVGGVKVMSMDLFLDAETSPVLWDADSQKAGYAWRGLMEAGALREFIADTAWGELDVLIVDLPPGSDKLPNLADVLPALSGAVVVTLPSAVSLGVVGRSIRMAREVLDTPILGVIENMAGYVCPSCGHLDELFPAGEVERLTADLDVPILGSISFDPLIGMCADEGRFFVTEYPGRPAASSIRMLAERLSAMLDL